MPYDFSYLVSDQENEFGHQESSDGNLVKGEYFVLLPDGRRQIVSYYVEGDSGFVANVKYEGGQYNPQQPYEPSADKNPSYQNYASKRPAHRPSAAEEEPEYKNKPSYSEHPDPHYHQPNKPKGPSPYSYNKPIEYPPPKVNDYESTPELKYPPAKPIFTIGKPNLHSNDETRETYQKPSLPHHRGHSARPNGQIEYTHHPEGEESIVPPNAQQQPRPKDVPSLRPQLLKTEEHKGHEPEVHLIRPEDDPPVIGRYPHDGYSPVRPISTLDRPHAYAHDGYIVHHPVSDPHPPPDAINFSPHRGHDGYTTLQYYPVKEIVHHPATLLKRPHEGYPSSEESYVPSHYYRGGMYVDLPVPEREHYVYRQPYSVDEDHQNSLVEHYLGPADQSYPNTYVHIEYPSMPSAHKPYQLHHPSLVHHSPPVQYFNPYGYTSERNKKKRRI